MSKRAASKAKSRQRDRRAARRAGEGKRVGTGSVRSVMVALRRLPPIPMNDAVRAVRDRKVEALLVRQQLRLMKPAASLADLRTLCLLDTRYARLACMAAADLGGDVRHKDGDWGAALRWLHVLATDHGEDSVVDEVNGYRAAVVSELHAVKSGRAAGEQQS
jgi:hypothetical protein